VRFDPTRRKEIGVEVFDLLKVDMQFANGALTIAKKLPPCHDRRFG
jgi:hypothetical protein